MDVSFFIEYIHRNVPNVIEQNRFISLLVNTGLVLIFLNAAAEFIITSKFRIEKPEPAINMMIPKFVAIKLTVPTEREIHLHRFIYHHLRSEASIKFKEEIIKKKNFNRACWLVAHKLKIN